MNFLRRISTRRLLSICALALVIVIGGTAVALATSGGGPKPPAKPLAAAVHDALEAPSVPGISASVHFTNDLIDASSLEGKDPILAGATGRLWASPAGGGKLRLELQAEESGNDSQVLVEGRHFQVYDGTTETVYEGTLPEEEAEAEDAVPSTGQIQGEIERAEKRFDLSGAIPSDVAGKATYTVQAAPSHDGGLLGRVELAWDAANGIPLRAAVYSSESSSPVLELAASDVSFEAVSESVFDISPPAEAEVVDLSPKSIKGPDGKATQAVGAEAVSKAVDFPLTAPQSLAGLPLAEVRAIEVGGDTAALATYGKGLGGIAVIESKSSPEGKGSTGHGGELGLPKVAIGGVTGEELDTALGSALRFSRGGVDYAVLGSVPPAAVEAAARACEQPVAIVPQVMPQPTPIEVRGLVKRYGDLVAVDQVDLTVEAGDVFGYLGPNGAGKTTSLRMMLGLIRPSAGTVRLFGRDPQLSVKALEGVAGFVEAPSFYPYLNGRENLRLLAALDGDEAASRIEESLSTVGLSDRAKDRVGGYSHGMRQRLGIAAALLRKPRLLMLDEPATGLDPGGMRDMRDLIRELSASGMTVLLSSHLLTEVEEVCNRVAIVRSGRVAYQGRLDDLRAQAGEGYLLRTTEDGIARRVAEAQAGISEVRPAPDGGLTFSAAGPGAVGALSLSLVESGALIEELSRRHATLEDLFFSLTEGDAAGSPSAAPDPEPAQA